MLLSYLFKLAHVSLSIITEEDLGDLYKASPKLFIKSAFLSSAYS